MKKIQIFSILTVLSFLLSASMKVVTTYPYIADITAKIGGDDVEVFSLGSGNWDPHFVVPRPSFIVKMRKADLLIVNGAQIEIGWLPPLISQAGNPKIQPGEKGFLDLSSAVEMIDIPTSVSRDRGDVHSEGNPHFILDPHNVQPVALAITKKLCDLDSPRSSSYRNRYESFIKVWNEKLRNWDETMLPLSGIKIIEYHRLYDYFARRYHFQILGTIEPLPGIPPYSRHIEGLIRMVKNENAKMIFQDVYHSDGSARFISQNTGIPVITLPHDVLSTKEAKDIFSLYDEMVRRIAR
jgi:zinc/manganese transport system substrate-binding protein